MLRSLLAASLFAAVNADVSFTPGPGLKKNPDGTYSRTYDAAAEGAAADKGGEGLPAWQNALLVGCAAAAATSSAFCQAGRPSPPLPAAAPSAWAS